MASSLRGIAVAASRNTPLHITGVTGSCLEAASFTTLSRRRESPRASRHISSAPRLPLHPPSSRAFHTSRTLYSSSKFTYGVAASFTAKDRRYNPETNVFNFNPYNRIRARRKDKSTRPGSGQDAFFVSRVGDSADTAFGIADGVGGWVHSGVDPADFAHGFCDYMAHAAYTHKPGEWDPPIGARSLMQRGYEGICKDPSVPAGGSTACVAIAKESGSLEVANLGDSGFVQLRLNAVHNYSEPQTHAFNTPYQLSVVPPKILAQAAAFGGMQLCDMPKDAHVSQHSLRHGDVLVFASDGVWDNLSSQAILKIVSKIMVGARAWVHTEKGIKVGDGLPSFIMADDGKSGAEDIPSLQSFVAVGITHEAKAASVNTKLDGPFAKEVQRVYPHDNWHGGKVDDICVVVAIVCEEGK
ncbi:Protein phosphatase 2C-like protein, mitochondrial [Lachnellula willkommii]|uniref:Protein phosphatase n=1 Tax=Lachnellula willkommii TaxID=215461 RepID=A0A559M921_9HELO|nr:Protein phosphatase 2C-like protein, mitochondrial [Lachnellula willkommii]